MFGGKEVHVRLKGKAKDVYLELKKRNDKEALSILRSIEKKIENLKGNPQLGDPIKKDLIPDVLKAVGIQNLYRVELSNYWRMLYTLEGTQLDIFVIVLTISDHKEYDHLFGYKGK